MNTSVRSRFKTLDAATDEIARLESQLAQLRSTKPALAQIEEELGQLTAAFSQLDTLRGEEAELASACEQAASEEAAILQNEDATEKQSVERLLKVRALRDVRNARLANARKRIGVYTDEIIFDIGQPLRQSLSTLAQTLLNTRRQRIQQLFNSLLGPAVDHGLPVSTDDLVKRSKPVIAAQQLCNWIGCQSRETPEQELAELRSELPRRWNIVPIDEPAI